MSTPHPLLPPPWRVDDAGDGEVLRVVAADGSILAYVLYEDKSVRRELMKRLTAKLPEAVGGVERCCGQPSRIMTSLAELRTQARLAPRRRSAHGAWPSAPQPDPESP
jgi:hypothetical protein